MTSDLRGGGLGLERDSPFRCALSLCGVSSGLHGWFVSNTFFRHNMTSGVIVALALGVGAWLLCATHLLIMFYLSVKFH